MGKLKARKKKTARKKSYQDRERRYDEALALMPRGQFVREMGRGADLLKRVFTRP